MNEFDLHDEYEDEEPLTEEELAEFRRLLLAKRGEIVQRMRQRDRGETFHPITEPADTGDVAQELSEQIFEARMAERDAKLLREINHALSKFEDGTYGYCEGTDMPIGRGRLRSRPWTRYSVAYKEEIELERRERRLVNEVEL
jgi:RNA polymerase-binding transcription factor